VQDRAVQKRWLEAHGFPVGPWAPAASPVEAEAAAARLGGPCRLKAARGGYDGRGQARAKTAAAAREAFPALGGGPVVVERELDLELELSVLVARRPSGEVVLHPPARNWHEDGILDLSVLPGPLPAPAVARASEVARGIAATLGLEGILAAEFFVVAGGGLYVNELAPRPHNTFHTTEAACATSQFEQHVRAVCDLPLGEGTAFRPAALANLLGDLWLGRTPDFSRALAVPEVKLRLYGKEPRPGRKLGHLLATAETAEEALARVREARRILEGGA
jgi:5-(carboxyamino)imidazole ribonucleotide synthase